MSEVGVIVGDDDTIAFAVDGSCWVKSAHVLVGQHVVMLAAMASQSSFNGLGGVKRRAGDDVSMGDNMYHMGVESVTTHRLNTHPDAEDLGFVMRMTTTTNMGIASVSQQGDCSFYSNDQKRRRFKSQTNVDAQTLEQVPAFV
ncbi:hypothetical protein Tco_0654100 [Tanacetum coccineum]|uniref:Uncharacterized protein n=1 Tax=Tanacetum coccineum TaxID=301880 RepID=A0ABQ4X2C1_9ASTR